MSWPIEVRPILKPHLPAILQIERLVYRVPITRGELVRMLSGVPVGWVALCEGAVRGYCVWEPQHGTIVIRCLAVHPEWDEAAIVPAFVGRLRRKCHEQPARYPGGILAAIADTEMRTHCLFRAMDFRATSVLRGKQAHHEDYYLFEWHMPSLLNVGAAGGSN